MDVDNVLLFMFVNESNHLEGLEAGDDIHFDALREFLNLEKLTINNVTKFVTTLNPNAYLRTEKHHTLMLNGDKLIPHRYSLGDFKSILKDYASINNTPPIRVHDGIYQLQPFNQICDNNRMARAVWLWQMTKFYMYTLNTPFLEMYYNQSLTIGEDVIHG